MNIRAYINKDYKEVLNLLTETMDYHRNIADPSLFKSSSSKLLSNYLRHMAGKARVGKAILVVSEEEGKITGFLYGELPNYSNEREKVGKRCGSINEIYVSPSFRGKKIGQRLMEYAENFFKNHNCEILLLHDVHRKNDLAIRLYEKLGYHVRVSEYVKEIK